MFSPPFVQKLTQSSKNLLLAGMGGGYDVFTAIPLYFELLGQGGFGNLVLSNFSFTENLRVKCDGVGTWLTNECLEVRYSDYVKVGKDHNYDERLGFPQNYFPEFHLSKWFHDAHSLDVPVYTYPVDTSTVSDMCGAFNALMDKYSLDTLVLIDAGVDSLLRHDEQGLGTFGEDLMSILAAKHFTIPNKYLLTVGLGTEGGISEEDFLENWAKIQQMGGWLGSVGWHPLMPSVKEYIHAYNCCVPTNSSINGQIVCAIEGHFKHYCSEPLKARGVLESDLYLTGLMGMCWFWDLNIVIAYKLYMDEVDDGKNLSDVQNKLRAARERAGLVNNRGKYIGTRPYNNLFN